MTDSQGTMPEFTFAPGETNIVGDRFSPSVTMFWLKTSVAASSTRVQVKAPNTLLRIIPLGMQTQTIPLRNVASVDTNTKFNLGSLILGIIFLLLGWWLIPLFSYVPYGSNYFLYGLIGVICFAVGIGNLCNIMSARLDFVNQGGGRSSVMVSILEKDKLMRLAQEIQNRVFADLESIRHDESMGIAQQQFAAQANSVLLQQLMMQQQMAAQQAAGAQQAGMPVMPVYPQQVGFPQGTQSVYPQPNVGQSLVYPQGVVPQGIPQQMVPQQVVPAQTGAQTVIPQGGQSVTAPVQRTVEQQVTQPVVSEPSQPTSAMPEHPAVQSTIEQTVPMLTADNGQPLSVPVQSSATQSVPVQPVLTQPISGQSTPTQPLYPLPTVPPSVLPTAPHNVTQPLSQQAAPFQQSVPQPQPVQTPESPDTPIPPVV